MVSKGGNDMLQRVMIQCDELQPIRILFMLRSN